MTINALKKTYDSRVVLSSHEFELQPGHTCALIGSNGSGKSTLAKIVAGVLEADDGVLPTHSTLDIGYMPQKSYAFRMSVLSNLCIGGCNKVNAENMLENLGLYHLAKSPAKKLSGGETARMALGRVLVGSHKLIVLDEPTASMDMESTAISEKLITEYCRQNNAAILWVTHSLAQARRVADQCIFLSDGKIVELGDAKKMLSSPDMEETKIFLRFYE